MGILSGGEESVVFVGNEFMSLHVYPFVCMETFEIWDVFCEWQAVVEGGNM